MAVNIPKTPYSGKIKEITIGSGDKAVTIGGETAYPFYLFEGEMPHPIRVAMEVYDAAPEDWAEAALAPFKDVAGDAVAWAKKCVADYGAEMICLQLASTDPNGKNTSAEDAAALVKKVSKQIILPAVVVAELYAGVKGQTELAALDRFVGLFRIVPVSTAIARAGGLYSKDYAKSHGLGLADAIVAATVDAEDADLRTLNVKHYPMFKGLKPAYRKTTDGQPSVPGDA